MSDAAGKTTSNDVECPSCGHRFALSDAVSHGLRAGIEAEFQAKQREAKEHADKRVAEAEARAKQLEEQARKRTQELEAREKSFDARVEAELKSKTAEIVAAAAKKAEQDQAQKLALLQEQVTQRDQQMQAARKRELELMKATAAAEDAKQNAELNAQRTLEQERETIRKAATDAARESAAEQHRLKDLEKDKQINDLRKSLGDAQRKAEQGSMETQGEVLELDFESRLAAYFPRDTIAAVPKGIRGADLIQTVNTPFGAACGSILWEMKNTKNWGGEWIGKLKNDAIDVRASVAILVSVVLPPEIKRFGSHEGVWVSDPLSALPLAVALREALIAVGKEREASVGKGEKMEDLYRYMCGVEFKQKIEGIVEAFIGMQSQLATERRAIEKQWKAREKQIERVIKNTVGLYGDVQGIIGGQIQRIPALELEGDVDGGRALSAPDARNGADAQAEAEDDGEELD